MSARSRLAGVALPLAVIRIYGLMALLVTAALIAEIKIYSIASRQGETPVRRFKFSRRKNGVDSPANAGTQNSDHIFVVALDEAKR